MKSGVNYVPNVIWSINVEWRNSGVVPLEDENAIAQKSSENLKTLMDGKWVKLTLISLPGFCEF